MNETNFTENSYEQAIIALFEQMGYRYECGYDIERDPRNPLYEEVLMASLRRVNPGMTEYALGELVKQLKEIDGADLVAQNDTFTDYLQNGIPVEDKVKGEYRTVNARLIDYEHPEKNDFRIVNQWTVEQFATKRCDLIVMVNGLPLVVMELKSPSNEGVGEDDAYNQIKAYQKQIPCLFVYNAFNVISDMLTTRVGTLTAKQERYEEAFAEELELISQKLKDEKLDNLRTYRAEVEELLNNDIVLRHNYYEGVVEHSIVGDSTVIKAVELLRDGERYRKILQEQDTEKK